MGKFSDDWLVQQAKQGNVDAFEDLARRYHEKIYQIILSLTKNHPDADDLAQETFMHAFKSLKGFKQKSSFYTWIYRIAVNLTLNYLKKRNKERNRRDVWNENYSNDGSFKDSIPHPVKNSLEMEFRKKLDITINSLPLPYKVSFLLVEFQGMTHRQAAYVLKCSENTVSWRMYRARKMLQEKLKPYLERGIL